jgi:hypothetical protein
VHKSHHREAACAECATTIRLAERRKVSGLVFATGSHYAKVVGDFSRIGEMAGADRSRMARITRALRRRETEPARKSDLPPIAEKAEDLEAIKKTVEDAASVGTGLWLSYLFVMFYIAVAAGAVTHVDLLLENPVKLPFLNIELPLIAFFFLAPILFLVIHAYTLVHFVLLGAKAVRFHDQLHQQIPDSEVIRDGLRRQLPSNIFVQFLAGPKDIRLSALGWLLKAIAFMTLIVGPILLLLLLEIQFLPYHHTGITWTQRNALLVDCLLIGWLWPKILQGHGELAGWRWWTYWAKTLALVALGLVAVAFSWTVSTFPGEWHERPLSWVVPMEPAALNAWLFSARLIALRAAVTVGSRTQ